MTKNEALAALSREMDFQIEAAATVRKMPAEKIAAFRAEVSSIKSAAEALPESVFAAIPAGVDQVVARAVCVAIKSAK